MVSELNDWELKTYGFWSYHFIWIYISWNWSRSSLTQLDVDFSALAKILNFNPIKLESDNYLFWKAQIYATIRAFDLNQFISTKCVFLGYSQVHHGYKCLDPSGRIYISRHVVSNMSEFPFPLLFLSTFHKVTDSSPSFSSSSLYTLSNLPSLSSVANSLTSSSQILGRPLQFHLLLYLLFNLLLLQSSSAPTNQTVPSFLSSCNCLTSFYEYQI